MNTITLRDATIHDLALLQYWDKQPHVIEATGEDDDWNWQWELTRKVAWREQLIAELNGRPIGIIQIIDPAEEETHYWGVVAENQRAIDIWIGEATDLGQGYGTIMMQQALQRCFANTVVTAVLIDPLVSNTRAIQFYQRIGFKIIEKRFFDEDECLVMKITRSDFEKN